jgi:peptidoglycan/xylan/chitin deacetylase (PgdA/CDA1 family)
MTGGVALAYHGIGQVSDGDDPQKLVVSPKHFESQVGMLLARGYRFLTAEQVIAEGSLPARAAALTFDDGFKSWLTIGLPLCEKLGVRATFYVTTGWLGDQHALVAGEAGRLLDAEDARALAAAGMELGAHSVSHPDLRTLDDIALEAELGESRSAIEEITGKPCRTMAYPYGLFDERVRDSAAAAGYELAWAWLPGRWDPLAAPRLPAPPRHGAGRLRLKLLGLRRPGR